MFALDRYRNHMPWSILGALVATGVSIDSRSIVPGDLFVALRGILMGMILLTRRLRLGCSCNGGK